MAIIIHFIILTDCNIGTTKAVKMTNTIEVGETGVNSNSKSITARTKIFIHKCYLSI